jgi:hypothetical protein
MKISMNLEACALKCEVRIDAAANNLFGDKL